jgi:hypothetical protein
MDIFCDQYDETICIDTIGDKSDYPEFVIFTKELPIAMLKASVYVNNLGIKVTLTCQMAT